MRKNRYITIFVLIISLFTFNFVIVHALDSGWDTSYDSGGWDSDSSWDYGSSWDSGSSYSSSGSGDSDPIMTTFIIAIFLIFFVAAIIEDINKQKNKNYSNDFKYTSYSIDKIKQIIPDFNEKEFLEKSYKIYLDTQNAWMDFDYKTLEKILTNELYNSYHSQLKALSIKKQKNIMKDFNLINNKIIDFNYTNSLLTIQTLLTVSFYDYVVDSNENTLRGNDKKKVVMTYKLTFTKTVSQNDNKCPNCNAPLKNNATNVCEYCKSVIISNSHDWILSKKESMNQRWE